MVPEVLRLKLNRAINLLTYVSDIQLAGIRGACYRYERQFDNAPSPAAAAGVQVVTDRSGKITFRLHKERERELLATALEKTSGDLVRQRTSSAAPPVSIVDPDADLWMDPARGVRDQALRTALLAVAEDLVLRQGQELAAMLEGVSKIEEAMSIGIGIGVGAGGGQAPRVGGARARTASMTESEGMEAYRALLPNAVKRLLAPPPRRRPPLPPGVAADPSRHAAEDDTSQGYYGEWGSLGAEDHKDSVVEDFDLWTQRTGGGFSGETKQQQQQQQQQGGGMGGGDEYKSSAASPSSQQQQEMDNGILPVGWRAVASRSRKGKFSYENILSGLRVSKTPTDDVARLPRHISSLLVACVLRLETVQARQMKRLRAGERRMERAAQVAGRSGGEMVASAAADAALWEAARRVLDVGRSGIEGDAASAHAWAQADERWGDDGYDDAAGSASGSPSRGGDGGGGGGEGGEDSGALGASIPAGPAERVRGMREALEAWHTWQLTTLRADIGTFVRSSEESDLNDVGHVSMACEAMLRRVGDPTITFIRTMQGLGLDPAHLAADGLQNGDGGAGAGGGSSPRGLASPGSGGVKSPHVMETPAPGGVARGGAAWVAETPEMMTLNKEMTAAKQKQSDLLRGLRGELDQLRLLGNVSKDRERVVAPATDTKGDAAAAAEREGGGESMSWWGATSSPRRGNDGVGGSGGGASLYGAAGGRSTAASRPGGGAGGRGWGQSRYHNDHEYDAAIKIQSWFRGAHARSHEMSHVVELLRRRGMDKHQKRNQRNARSTTQLELLAAASGDTFHAEMGDLHARYHADHDRKKRLVLHNHHMTTRPPPMSVVIGRAQRGLAFRFRCIVRIQARTKGWLTRRRAGARRAAAKMAKERAQMAKIQGNFANAPPFGSILSPLQQQQQQQRQRSQTRGVLHEGKVMSPAQAAAAKNAQYAPASPASSAPPAPMALNINAPGAAGSGGGGTAQRWGFAMADGESKTAPGAPAAPVAAVKPEQHVAQIYGADLPAVAETVRAKLNQALRGRHGAEARALEAAGAQMLAAIDKKELDLGQLAWHLALLLPRAAAVDPNALRNPMRHYATSEDNVDITPEALTVMELRRQCAEALAAMHHQQQEKLEQLMRAKSDADVVASERLGAAHDNVLSAAQQANLVSVLKERLPLSFATRKLVPTTDWYVRLAPGPAAERVKQELQRAHPSAHKFVSTGGLETVGPLSDGEVALFFQHQLIAPGALLRNGCFPYYLPITASTPDSTVSTWMADAERVQQAAQIYLRESTKTVQMDSPMTPRQLAALRQIWSDATGGGDDSTTRVPRADKAALVAAMRQLHHAQALHAVFREPDLLLNISTQLDFAAAAAQDTTHPNLTEFHGTISWDEFVWSFAQPSLVADNPALHPGAVSQSLQELGQWASWSQATPATPVVRAAPAAPTAPIAPAAPAAPAVPAAPTPPASTVRQQVQQGGPRTKRAAEARFAKPGAAAPPGGDSFRSLADVPLAVSPPTPPAAAAAAALPPPAARVPTPPPTVAPPAHVGGSGRRGSVSALD
jgi:hypothetical protein